MTGNELRAAREAMGLTRPQVARATGVALRTIEKLEWRRDAEAEPQIRRSSKYDALVVFYGGPAPAPYRRRDPRWGKPAVVAAPRIETAGDAYRAKIRAALAAAC